MDIAELAEELGIDESAARRLLETFVTATDSDLGELRNAVQAGHVTRCAGLAHHIKGAAANLDLETIREAAYRLEMTTKSGVLDGADAVVTTIETELSQLRAELT